VIPALRAFISSTLRTRASMQIENSCDRKPLGFSAIEEASPSPESRTALTKGASVSGCPDDGSPWLTHLELWFRDSLDRGRPCPPLCEYSLRRDTVHLVSACASWARGSAARRRRRAGHREMV
jgi:hypothetical protein